MTFIYTGQRLLVVHSPPLLRVDVEYGLRNRTLKCINQIPVLPPSSFVTVDELLFISLNLSLVIGKIGTWKPIREGC